MPPVSQVHINRALTNVSIMYGNEGYIATDVWPIVPVNARSDDYFIYKKEDFLSSSGLDAQGRPKSLRAPGARAAEIDFSVSTGTYSAKNFALDGLVTDEEYEFADSPLAPEIDRTEQITERLLIDQELFVAATVATRGSYPSANKATLTTGSTGTSWAQYASANSLPLSNIATGRLQVIKSIAKAANTLACGTDTALTLLDHPSIKDLIKYTHPDSLTMSGLPKKVRGLDIIEGPQQSNTAAEGVAYSGSYIWDADDGTAMALIYYRNPRPSIRSLGFGWTFDAPDATTRTRGLSVRKWREEDRGGTKIRVAITRDYKAVALDGNNKLIGGYLINGCTL